MQSGHQPVVCEC